VDDFQAPLPTALVVIDSSEPSGDVSLQLLPVANRPLLLRVLDSLADARVGHVVLALEPGLIPRVRSLLGADGPRPFEISYLQCNAGEGLLGALRSADEFAAHSPWLLHWGCALFKTPLRSQLGEHPTDPLEAVLLADVRRTEPPVTELATERLAAVAGRARSQSRGSLAGVALLGAGAQRAAREVEPGRGADLEVLAVVERMTRLGGCARAVPASRCWRFKGAADAALEVNRFVLEDLTIEPLGFAPSGFDSRAAVIQGPTRIDPSVTLERSTVRGPVVIDPRAQLIDAYIGPYTSIGADVCVEGAEIENSIILGETRISHLGRRMEASVIGPRARICQDFRLPRALRLEVGEGAKVSLT
jgi:glucose-1-phosphate thymidylyltransferase